MHLFPYQHFVTASLTHRDETDRLRIAFSSHDVELAGHNLRALLIALQDFAVKWMRPIPQRYQRLDANRDGVITSIRVEEAK